MITPRREGAEAGYLLVDDASGVHELRKADRLRKLTLLDGVLTTAIILAAAGDYVILVWFLFRCFNA